MTNANRVVFHIAAPPWPEPRDQRVPPILRSSQPASLPGYSKGAWGLSVLLRVDGIFTATSISPSLRLRQCSSRYAVHARRNLPDKELRSELLQLAEQWTENPCVTSGSVISADLCTSPCSSDYIFTRVTKCLAYSL